MFQDFGRRVQLSGLVDGYTERFGAENKKVILCLLGEVIIVIC